MLSAFVLAAAAKAPALRLSPLFSDGAVLQRGMELPIFGVATPGAKVAVTLAGQSAAATAGADGRWTARLRPVKADGSLTLTAVSNGETVSAKDLRMGEVWLAAGQSNMEFPESSATDFEQAKGEARPDVRFFTVEKATADRPLPDVKGHWTASTPATVGYFSAVALSFAREVQHRLGVPVGIVQATWGGTPAEAWTSRSALAAEPTLKPLVDAYDAAQTDYPSAMAAYKKAVSDFVNFKHLGGNEGFMRDWQAPETSDADWSTVAAATPFPDDFDGAAWYRKAVDIPAEWLGKPLLLSLGSVDDFDTTYFDGIRVGRTGLEDDNGDATTPRRYRIAPGIVRAGRNVIAVRVFDQGGAGGILGPVGEMRIGLADGSASIPLDGEWRFRIEKALDPKAQIPQRPVGVGNPNVPTMLWNGMVAPLVPYGIRGVIWYQGEANATRPAQYRALFPALIRDWRSAWGEGDFPFLFVQLPNYMARKDVPSESDWAALREAQASVLTLPNTGMAVAIDQGEAGDIHPKAKREVGRRLALNAFGRVYGEPVVYEGPSFASLDVVGDVARVTFHNGALLTTDGAAPRGFQLAGADGRWAWAQGTIEGSTVVLRAPGVSKPVAVRYGWADNPDVNLTNRAGLPAVPFRTDPSASPIVDPRSRDAR